MPDYYIKLDFTIPMSKESQDTAMDAIAIVDDGKPNWDALLDEDHEDYGKPTFENLFPEADCDVEPVRAMALAFAQRAVKAMPDPEDLEHSSPLTQLFISKCDEGLHVTNCDPPYLDALVAFIQICQEHLDTPPTGFKYKATRGFNEGGAVWDRTGQEAGLDLSGRCCSSSADKAARLRRSRVRNRNRRRRKNPRGLVRRQMSACLSSSRASRSSTVKTGRPGMLQLPEIP